MHPTETVDDVGGGVFKLVLELPFDAWYVLWLGNMVGVVQKFVDVQKLGFDSDPDRMVRSETSERSEFLGVILGIATAHDNEIIHPLLARLSRVDGPRLEDGTTTAVIVIDAGHGRIAEKRLSDLTVDLSGGVRV